MREISVAMATYRGEKFLAQQLESIKAQTLAPLELVVCDDCSTDRTVAILEDFAATAPFPVHIHRNAANLGYIDNFMKAISLCKGKYVALSDQDDVWYDTKLQTAWNSLETNGAWLHSHSATLIDERGAAIGELRPLKQAGIVSYETFSPWDTFFGFTCTFRRDMIAAVPLEKRPIDLIYGDKLMAHDRWITHLALLSGPVDYTDTPLAGYRQHGDNAFGARGRGVMRKIRKFRAEYVNYLSKRASISQAMTDILRDFDRKGAGDNRDNLSVWRSLARDYGARRDLFVNHKSFPRRAAALVARYRRDRNLKGLAQEFAAAAVLAF